MNDQEATIFKSAIASSQRAAAAAAAAKIWRVINRPNPAAAVAFINSSPPQGAGEAAFSLRPDGTVDTYYYL